MLKIGVSSEYLSLTGEANEYVFENGRRYHGYKPGRYMLPNDENEMDREDMKHHISMLITKGRLHLAPIGADPEVILDIGTGTGIWAIDTADLYPNAKVIATDLSPNGEPRVSPPPTPLIIPGSHQTSPSKSTTQKKTGSSNPNPSTSSMPATSSTASATGRVSSSKLRGPPNPTPHTPYTPHTPPLPSPSILTPRNRVLKPGGYVELVEMHVIPSSPDNTLPPNSQIMELYTTLAEVSQEVGLDLSVAQKYGSMMVSAGFENVVEEVFDLPIGDWMQDRRMKEGGGVDADEGAGVFGGGEEGDEG
ncbi:hypothetical protein V499_03390 [Pseudogymnoascus sp. VKM F-103]|nr:hypothetical protein V499_03390 [Pseudogymnoascus sp. VKM F-103]